MPEKIKKVLFETLEKLELKNKVEDGLVLEHWDEIVGPSISKNAQPQSIRGRVLFVATSSAVWAQELNFIKKELLEKLNDNFKRKIKDVRFQPRGQKGSTSKNNGSSERADLFKKGNVKLKPEESRKIEALTADIPDAKVKRKLAEILVLDRKFKIWKSKQKLNS